MPLHVATSKPDYLHLWREFAHTRLQNNTKTRLELNHLKSWKNDAMNVATVVPVHEIPREMITPEDDEEIQPNRTCTRDFIGIDEVTKISFLVPLLSETLGTFLLVFLGCSSCIPWNTSVQPSNFHIAFTFGLSVAALAHVLGPVSGCHINPGVTLGLLISGNCSLIRSFCYIVCQCCGAIAGAALLKLVLPADLVQNRLGQTMLRIHFEPGHGVMVELMITFVLVLVVLATTDSRRSDAKGWAPLAIGLTITALHLAVIPMTGSSMNPARSFGPAVILGYWQNQWIYWVGPLGGALIAGLLYKTAFRPKSKDEDEASYDF